MPGPAGQRQNTVGSGAAGFAAAGRLRAGESIHHRRPTCTAYRQATLARSPGRPPQVGKHRAPPAPTPATESSAFPRKVRRGSLRADTRGRPQGAQPRRFAASRWWSWRLLSSALARMGRLARHASRHKRCGRTISPSARHASRENPVFRGLNVHRSRFPHSGIHVEGRSARRRSGRTVQFDGIRDEADDGSAAGALGLGVADCSVFAGE